MLGLLCPVCGGRLAREKAVWRCESRHSFDAARSGYVNLLPPSASGKRHGDDKRMVAARTAFLSRGYYDHLIGAVAGSCAQLTGPDACVLDAGCGEGTYTRAIYDALAAKANVIVRDIPVFDWLNGGTDCYKAKDKDEFERMIKEIYEGKLPSLRENGRKAVENMDIKKLGEKLVKIYNGTAEGGD